MKKTTVIAATFAALAGGLAHAADAPMSNTLNTEQAQARQLGIYLGGTASQYDLCVKKGFLPKGNQSGEEFVKATLEQMRALHTGRDESAYVQEGWDMIKKEISENEGFFTHEKCTAVGKEWTKMLASMRKK